MKLTYSEYCRNRTIRANREWVNGYFVVDGVKYTGEQLIKAFPTETHSLIDANDKRENKGENNCKKQNYIYDIKSY